MAKTKKQNVIINVLNDMDKEVSKITGSLLKFNYNSILKDKRLYDLYKLPFDLTMKTILKRYAKDFEKGYIKSGNTFSNIVKMDCFLQYIQEEKGYILMCYMMLKGN